MATASTGDLRNNIAKLQTELKSLRYTGSFDVTSLSRGEPMAFLPLMHFILLESDPLLAAHFAHLNHSLTAKRDIRFVESAWKLLRDVFDFKPVLSKEQFFSEGFAERKMLLLTEVAHMCKKMGADLARRKDPKSTKSAPPNAQAQPKTSSSASPLTPRLPINASWNLQTSVSNTETIKNNSHQVSAPKILTEFVPRLPQQAFDPTKYASFDILDELNQSYHEFVHLSPFRASLQGKELASDTLQKRQFRIPVDIPHSALKGADSRFHWPQSPSIGIQTEKTGIAAWEQCEEHMLSGVIADPDFSALYSDAPSHVLPTADISASMLHEPDTAPPPPAAYPQRQPPLRRSILKTSRVAEEQSTARDNPLRLQDLKASPRHQTGSTSADRVPVGEVDSSPIRGESRLLASTSATSGSRSLNRGDASSSGAGPAAAPVTRIEAARNRWNSAGLILPVGYKGNGSNGSAVVGSIKSVNGGVVEWAGGTSLNGVRGKRETSHEEVRQDVTGGTDIHHLEGLVSNLMGVVTKLWTSNESMKEHISILSERLARVEQKTDAVIDRLDMPPPVGALIASSPNEDEDASCSSTHFLRENFKQYCSPQRAFNENKLPKNYTDIGFSLTHNDRESILTRGELDVSRVPPSSVHPSAPSIPSPMVEQSHSFEAATTSSSVPANSISIPREPFAVSLNEAPTGEYIRNIEERLKVTSELLRKAKMGHMHLQPTTSA